MLRYIRPAEARDAGAIAEQLAVGRGVTGIVVATANHRIAAHTFYERLGYTWTGRRYAKRL